MAAGGNDIERIARAGRGQARLPGGATGRGIITLGDMGHRNEARAMAARFLELAPRPTYDRELAILAPPVRP
jgi:hypothetical protein